MLSLWLLSDIIHKLSKVSSQSWLFSFVFDCIAVQKSTANASNKLERFDMLFTRSTHATSQAAFADNKTYWNKQAKNITG